MDSQGDTQDSATTDHLSALNASQEHSKNPVACSPIP